MKRTHNETGAIVRTQTAPKIEVDQDRVWVFGYRDTLYVELRERVPGYYVAVIDGFFREDQLDLMERVIRRANREIKKRMHIQKVRS